VPLIVVVAVAVTHVLGDSNQQQ